MRKFKAVPGKGIYASEDVQADRRRLEDDADTVFDYDSRMLNEVRRIMSKVPDEDIQDALQPANELSKILQRILSDYTKRLKAGGKL